MRNKKEDRPDHFRIEEPPDHLRPNRRRHVSASVSDNLFRHNDDVSGILGDYTEAPESDDPDCILTMSESNLLAKILAERNRRRKESLRIFSPMESQEAFLASNAPERLARGGNRGGKTLICAVEVARAVTGQDPYGKYPKRNGRFIIVGWDLQHCADVCWRKLYKPGAFKIIKDPTTKEYRAFNPELAYDRSHEYLAEESPPLIPKRFIKEISWEDKKKGIPKVVRLTTGWEIVFYSSKGDPPQGIDVDGAWFDEEIQLPLWYKEISARLLDRRKKMKDGSIQYPRFIWSATPLAGTEQLLELHQRAQDQANDITPMVQEFFLGLLDNKHISAESKKEFIDKLNNEDEYKVRVLGDFAIAGTRVYPEFTPRGVHGIDDFPVPPDWTRYCAIDPGRQVCAVLFAAVPPPYCRDYDPKRVYFYKELYLRRCDAKIFAKAMKDVTKSEQIEQWFIDHRAGRMTEIASGRTPEEQYSAALKELGVKCVKTGHGFTWGADDVASGILAARAGMHIDPEIGASRFVFFRSGLKNFLWEMDRYSYKRNPQGIVTDDVIKLNDHLVDCFRYLAQANLRYVKPKVASREGYTNKALKAKRDRERAKSGYGNSIMLG